MPRNASMQTLITDRRSVLRGIAGGAAGIALAGSSLSAAKASGAKRPVVVELYTSQVCSSCPPADRILTELAQERQVIALSLHVDYWDYIGWKDPFAQASLTQRQRDYARRFNARSIYTPQIIVDGLTHVVGSRGMDVMKLISRAEKLAETSVPMSLRRRADGRLVVDIAAGSGMADITCAIFDHFHATDVRRGENANQTIENANVVRVMETVGTWTGAPTSVVLPDDHEKAGTGQGIAVFLQEKSFGPVIGSAQIFDLAYV